MLSAFAQIWELWSPWIGGYVHNILVSSLAGTGLRVEHVTAGEVRFASLARY
jgi:hypothetical protein